MMGIRDHLRSTANDGERSFGGDMVRSAVLIGTIAVVMAACLVVFIAGTRIERVLGKTGNTVLSRLLGVILAAMAVQFVVDGVKALWG